MSNRNDQPQFEVVQTPYCDECGHYHHSFQPHPELNEMCKNGRCCNVNAAADSDEN